MRLALRIVCADAAGTALRGTTSATTQAPTDGRAAVTREVEWAAVALDIRRAALMTAG
jgi:hypothetical protein